MIRATGLLALLCVGACSLGACSQTNSLAAPPPQVVPQLQYRTNSVNMPGYVSPCAGGQPQMQDNCSSTVRH